MGEKVIRELTRSEKSAIRRLVTSLCANYDSRYGCLPLGDECYMLLKCWTGALCRYFRDAVLPNNTVLEASLSSNVQKTAICPVCGSKTRLKWISKREKVSFREKILSKLPFDERISFHPTVCCTKCDYKRKI